jgi:hypothetical protein
MSSVFLSIAACLFSALVNLDTHMNIPLNIIRSSDAEEISQSSGI